MNNEKKFLEISDQITYLEVKKGFEIDINKRELQIFLHNYNYYNVINSSKVLYAYTRENGHHLYKKVKISELLKSYESMNKLEMEFLEQVRDIELKINSRVSYEISKRYNEGKLDKRIKNSFCDIIRNANLKFSLDDISNDELVANAYRLGTNLSFGQIHMIHQKFDNGFKSEIGSLTGLNSEEIKTLVTLRNYIAHNTPLLVALTNSRDSDKRIKLLKKLNFNNNIINSVIQYNENCGGGHEYD